MHTKDFIYGLALLPIVLLFFLPACATTDFRAGEPKNSLPLLGLQQLEEVHSIAAPLFYGDTVRWREYAQGILTTAGPRLTVIPLPAVDTAVPGITDELSTSDPAFRTALLLRIGSRLHADAVLNGIVLWKEKPEIILQVISSVDGRVIFWQSADFAMNQGASAQGQQELLKRMLAPVLEYAGTRQRIAPPASPHPKVGTPPASTPDAETRAAEPQSRQEKRIKPEKKQKKTTKPMQPPEDIGPM